MKKYIQLAASAVLPLLILLLRPLGTTQNQSVVLAALVLTIIWWCTRLVERTIASVFLLTVFCLFGQTPLQAVFSFPLSENFLLIVISFLFSEGIVHSGLPDRLLLPLLEKRAGTLPRIIVSMLLLVFIMIFVIPQPFSRIIVLSLIYRRFFQRSGLSEQTQQVLMLGLYIFTVTLNMLFIRGDIILNNALLAMGGVSMTEGAWMTYMSVPTLVLCLAVVVLYRVLFRRALTGIRITAAETGTAAPMTGREKLNLIFILAVVLLWATESLHGIRGLYIVLAGTVLMFPMGMLHLQDFKSVNLKLLVFLTAAFSIGGVMKNSGTAQLIFSRFTPLFPPSFGWTYVVAVVITAMALHMVLGSNITTMSVVVPGILSIGAGAAPPEILLFLIYIAVCGHYLLPFHHVILLLGEGNAYYSSKHLMRFGAVMTGVVMVCILILYITWWRLLGLL